MATNVMTARTVKSFQTRKAGFFSRMGDALWGTFYLIPSGFFLPGEPVFRRCDALSVREKAELEAYLTGL